MALSKLLLLCSKADWFRLENRETSVNLTMPLSRFLQQLDQVLAESLFLVSRDSQEAKTGEAVLNCADDCSFHPNLGFDSRHLQLEIQAIIFGQVHVSLQPTALQTYICHDTFAFCVSP